MKSDFEKSAARAAVDAVEARWRKNNELQLRQASRKRWRKVGAMLILIAIASVVVVAVFGDGDLSLGGFRDGALSVLQRLGSPSQLSDDGRRIDVFARRLNSIVDAPVQLLSDMPPDDNPKRAAAGTSFAALSADGRGGVRLFTLSPDGKGGLLAARCSPFCEDSHIPWSVFRQECRKPYLIRIGEWSYLCGSHDLQDAERLKALVKKSGGGEISSQRPIDFAD